MANLYQAINNVPGLNGNSYAKQKQLYEKMGSPMGNYTGSYDQNIWLLNQINNGSATKAMTVAPAPAAPAPVAPAPVVENSLATDYAAPGVQAAPPEDTPLMENLDAYWNPMIPTARASAMEVVDPELLRNYAKDRSGLLNEMARSGAGRFGSAWGQTGMLQADAMRNREAMIQDYVGQYKKGFKDLWYDPTLKDWNNSLTTRGANPVDVPTWDEWTAANSSSLPKYTSGQNGSNGANPYQSYIPNSYATQFNDKIRSIYSGMEKSPYSKPGIPGMPSSYMRTLPYGIPKLNNQYSINI